MRGRFDSRDTIYRESINEVRAAPEGGGPLSTWHRIALAIGRWMGHRSGRESIQKGEASAAVHREEIGTMKDIDAETIREARENRAQDLYKYYPERKVAELSDEEVRRFLESSAGARPVPVAGDSAPATAPTRKAPPP